ncbi:MAG: exodeoxyribonuclease VII large subunit [Bilophila wadsworthia]
MYLKKSVVLFKLHVHAASVIEASAGGRGPEPVKNVEGTISHLKELGFKRIPFPKRATAISVIHSKSHAANVFADFKNELDLKSVNVESLPTAMTDPSAIARAIDQASGNVVVLIRGGGDDAEFTTFQHDDVVKALARKAAHRITGLGHYGNLTYADIIADFARQRLPARSPRPGATDPYRNMANGKEALEEQAALIKALRISKLKWMLVALAGIALAGYLGFFR